MISIIIISSVWGAQTDRLFRVTKDEEQNSARSLNLHRWEAQFRVDIVRRLSIPQFVLAILAVTSYHVQVVTRLASGYSIWYIWLASNVVTKSQGGFARYVTAKSVIRWMVIYALVQGGLFAAFLPPA